MPLDLCARVTFLIWFYMFRRGFLYKKKLKMGVFISLYRYVLMTLRQMNRFLRVEKWQIFTLSCMHLSLKCWWWFLYCVAFTTLQVKEKMLITKHFLAIIRWTKEKMQKKKRFQQILISFVLCLSVMHAIKHKTIQFKFRAISIHSALISDFSCTSLQVIMKSLFIFFTRFSKEAHKK